MSGIEVPAAAIGVAGFCFSALCGCMKGLLLLKSATSANQDLSAIRLMLECEMHELQNWAQEVGLLEPVPTLRIELRDIKYIQPVLEQIQTLVSDLHNLRSEFRIDLRETDKELDTTDTSSQPFWRRIRASPSLAKVSNNSRQAWRRILWISGDATQVEKLLRRIRVFVQQLRTYLDRTQRAALDNKIEIMYRTQISSSLSHPFLSWKGKQHDPVVSDAAVSAAARLRNTGLLLDLLPTDQTSDASPTMHPATIAYSIPLSVPSVPEDQAQQLMGGLGGTPMRLSKTRLRVKEPFSFGRSRQLGYLDDRLVLLEWRLVGDSLYRSTEPRVNKTSCFLRELGDSSFHSLRCVGYVDDPDMCRYGYVLDIPATPGQVSRHSKSMPPNSRSSSFPLAIVSVKDLIDKQLCPSLNIRLQLAITMMSTVLQLHTSGWLHKALHWDNVLTFATPAHDTACHTSHLTCQPEVYLTGYSQARADSHPECTEPSLAQLYAHLYRHPSSLGASRVRYRKSFDLFSLGCMLLELGLWSHLQDALNDALRPVDSQLRPDRTVDPHAAARGLLTAKALFVESLPRLDLRAEGSSLASRVLQHLAAAAGDMYAGVVAMCLGAGVGEPAQCEDTDYMLRLENDAILKLRGLANAL